MGSRKGGIRGNERDAGAGRVPRVFVCVWVCAMVTALVFFLSLFACVGLLSSGDGSTAARPVATAPPVGIAGVTALPLRVADTRGGARPHHPVVADLPLVSGFTVLAVDDDVGKDGCQPVRCAARGRCPTARGPGPPLWSIPTREWEKIRE